MEDVGEEEPAAGNEVDDDHREGRHRLVDFGKHAHEDQRQGEKDAESEEEDRNGEDGDLNRPPLDLFTRLAEDEIKADQDDQSPAHNHREKADAREDRGAHRAIIFITKKIMDDLSYERDGNKNVLTMKKIFEKQEEKQ